MTLAQLVHYRPREFWWACGVVSLVVVVVYCLTASAYLNHDCFVMAEAAQSVLAGKTLYGNACWDNKPPLALLAYALPQLLVPHSYSAMQGFLAIWLLVQAAVFAYFFRDESIESTVLGCFILLFVPLLDKEFIWASSEHWHNLFALLVILPSIRLWRDGRGSLGLAALTGASVVLAMHCRQTGILLSVIPCIAIVGTGLSFRRKGELAVVGLIGAGIAWGMILALCFSIGNLNGYFDATFMAPRRYSQHRLGALVETAYFFGATYRSSAIGLLAVGTMIGSLRLRSTPLIGIVAFVTVLQILLPSRQHQHYVIQMLPLLAVTVQSSIGRLSEISHRSARNVAFAVAAFLFVNAAFVGATLPNGRGSHAMHDLTEVAAALNLEAQATDTLFAVGEDSAYLYFATDIDSVHPVFWDLFFGSLSKVLPYRIEDVIDQYRQSPPSLLVLRENVFKASQSLSPVTADAQPCQAAVELSQELIQREEYREFDRLRGWVLLRRSGPSGVAHLRQLQAGARR